MFWRSLSQRPLDRDVVIGLHRTVHVDVELDLRFGDLVGFFPFADFLRLRLNGEADRRGDCRRENDPHQPARGLRTHDTTRILICAWRRVKKPFSLCSPSRVGIFRRVS